MGAEFGGMRLPDGVAHDHFVEWRPRWWGPAVGAALRGAGPIDGQRVLELGPRSGRISSLLAFNGAEVVGAELDRTDLTDAVAETERWGVDERVEFVTYSGLPDDLPEGPFDVVFSKSVLVVVPGLDEFFGALASRLAPGGRLVCAENRKGGSTMATMRRLAGKQWVDTEQFSGVGPEFMASLSASFGTTEVLARNPLVCALRARP